MQKIRTHYENLQVTENASIEVIRGAYKYLAQKWHPDKYQGDRARAEGVMKILNTAYEVLSDPERRKEHDKWIALQRSTRGEFQPEQIRRDAEAMRQDQAREEAMRENLRRDAEVRRREQEREEAISENLRRDVETRRQDQAREEATRENLRRDAEAGRQGKFRGKD